MSKPDSTPLDKRLEFLKDRLSKTVDLAWERAIAHDENPGYYPLPSDPKSLERALYKLFETLPRRKKKDLVEQVNRTLKASKTERAKIYGELADVDFRSSISLVSQIKAKPVPESMRFDSGDLPEARSRLKLNIVRPQKSSKPVPAQVVEATELGFNMTSLKCIRSVEIRKDEINLAGVGVDNVGGEVDLQPFFVSDYKEGDTVALGAQERLFNFKLTVGQFPKAFTATVVLVEKDLVRNEDSVKAVITVCYAVSAALAAITIGMITVAVAGGPLLGPLIVGLSAATFGFGLVGKALDLMRDDLAGILTDVLVLDAPVAPGTIFDRGAIAIEAGLRDQGLYEAAIRWVAA